MATSSPPPYAASPLPAHAKVLPAHSKGATQKRRLLAAALEMAAGLQRRSLVLAVYDGAKPLDESPHGRICQDKSCTQTNTQPHTHTHKHTHTHTHTHKYACAHARMYAHPATHKQAAGRHERRRSKQHMSGKISAVMHAPCARVHVCKQPRSLYRVPECARS
jgi:hypothetical protein